jgi:NAD(P)-dependent dehydrogenase (short-subunit alcohol dehydrogenase family)
MPGATLVTGASSGIGLETAVYLAQKGFRVVGTMRDLSRRVELDKAAHAAGVTVDATTLDLNDRASIDRAIPEVAAKYGAIDALVNNAGVQMRGFFEDVTEEEIRKVFETNVFGTLAVTRAVIPHMRAVRKGRIVFLSSVAGLIGSLGLSAYSASKFAIEGFGESMAIELALYGISVSLIEPGNVNTPIWKNPFLIAKSAASPESPNHPYWLESERIADWAVKSSPIRPLDVAKAIYHAVSAGKPKRRYLVGHRPAGVLMVRRFLPAQLFDKVYTGAVVNKLKKVGPPNT